MSIASLSPEHMKELEAHGHQEYWEVATYGQHVTLECVRCGQVLLELTPEVETPDEPVKEIDPDISLLTEEICPELTQVFQNIRRGQSTLFLGKIGVVSIVHRLTKLLPEMNNEQKEKVKKIHQSIGTTNHNKRPFRAPHYSIGPKAMKGTVEKGIIKYGEMSLAHEGVLFLDDFTKFSPEVLATLQTFLYQKKVSFYGDDICSMPANFLLIGGCKDYDIYSEWLKKHSVSFPFFQNVCNLRMIKEKRWSDTVKKICFGLDNY